MFRFLRFAFVLASIAVLAGCDTPNNISGTLRVTSTINLVSPGGNNERLAAGTYQAVVQMNGNSGDVFITTNDGQLTFEVPSLVADQEGTIRISAAEMGQEFGLNGNISDSQDPFDRIVSGSCVLGSHQEYKCHTAQDGSQDCQWVTVTDYGTDDVREIGYTSYKNIDIKLVGRRGTVGRFTGSYSYGDTVTSSQVVSACR